MKKTNPSPSLGKYCKLLAGFGIAQLCVVLLMSAGPVMAKDYANGIAAFEARDYAEAATLWRRDARAGSAQAVMQLGLMADFGLGTARDPVAAFAYYRLAAGLGLPEAAFNVGVMLDAGTGVERDVRAAGIWYAKAALGGSTRAAYNLGLLYEGGIGVPVNSDLAALWLGRASALPDAQTALQALKPSTIAPSDLAPTPLSAKVLHVGDALMGEFIWTAPPGPKSALFGLQVYVPDAPMLLISLQTDASAIKVPLHGDPVAWRVTRIDPASGQYWASDWQPMGGAKASAPSEIVTIAVNPDDTRAAAVARDLARNLQSGGLIIQVANTDNRVTANQIQYRFATDAALARDLASFLPGFSGVPVVESTQMNTAPGEVVVNLVLDP